MRSTFSWVKTVDRRVDWTLISTLTRCFTGLRGVKIGRRSTPLRNSPPAHVAAVNLRSHAYLEGVGRSNRLRNNQLRCRLIASSSVSGVRRKTPIANGRDQREKLNGPVAKANLAAARTSTVRGDGKGFQHLEVDSIGRRARCRPFCVLFGRTSQAIPIRTGGSRGMVTDQLPQISM